MATAVRTSFKLDAQHKAKIFKFDRFTTQINIDCGDTREAQSAVGDLKVRQVALHDNCTCMCCLCSRLTLRRNFKDLCHWHSASACSGDVLQLRKPKWYKPTSGIPLYNHCYVYNGNINNISKFEHWNMLTAIHASKLIYKSEKFGDKLLKNSLTVR